jgi:hypothetical protein
MAKKETRILALKIGHTTTWRQTVNVGTAANPKKHTIVFEPGEDKEVTQAEIDGGLKPFIDVGLLVDPNRDPKGRQRRPPAPESTEAEKVIAKLEKKVEELSTRVSELTAENDDLKKQLSSR